MKNKERTVLYLNNFVIGATSDIGIDRETQEDFVQFAELDDENLLVIIADGSGSRPSIPQPANIICSHIIEFIQSLYEEQPKDFLNSTEYYIKRAMLSANKILGAFKMGNEELYSGFASSVTCVLFSKNRFIVGHTGNTRFYILRNGNAIQLTKDHTKASALLEDGKITMDTYHVHPDRLTLTSCLGMIVEPRIQTFSGNIKENDIAIMTTDGVHYAIQPNFISEIILQSNSCDQAAFNLIEASRDIIKYPDNMTAAVICQKKLTT